MTDPRSCRLLACTCESVIELLGGLVLAGSQGRGFNLQAEAGPKIRRRWSSSFILTRMGGVTARSTILMPE